MIIRIGDCELEGTPQELIEHDRLSNQTCTTQDVQESVRREVNKILEEINARFIS